jgi:isoaspartyl peptidase/L-asparaginase-like protein (Ntn-hydrolase superfamily)
MQSPPKRASNKGEPDNQPSMETDKIGLAIHGGAGTIERSDMTPEREREYHTGLERALTAGYEILKRGGSSLDATEVAVRILEDDPHFNAGKGSVFTSAGMNEMDAAIMDGKTLAAGAVASLKHIKNPINLARLVMEKSGHVMLDSEGAEAFAKENGIELVDQKYFFTQERWDALQKMKAAEKSGTAQWVQSLWIRTGISLLRLQPAARQTSGRDASAIRRSSAPALTRTTPHVPFRRPETVNILSARRLLVMSQR